MRVLEMLSKVIGSEELLCLVAFTKLVSLVQVLCAKLPLRWVRKLHAAVTAHIGSASSKRCVKGSFNACQGRTAPRVLP